MKIENILGNFADPNDLSPISHLDGYGAVRNEEHPEIAELLNARLANMLFNSRNLARDEIDLANFIVNLLDVNPRYVPSDTLLHAIRSINEKLSRGMPFKDVNRNA
jgi:hypothetical protein